MENRFGRKIWAIAIAVLALICFCMPAYAAEYDDKDIDCKGAMLIDESTGMVLYSKNATEQLAPASTTKIMTASLLMEKIESGEIALDDEVTVGKEIAKVKGSVMGLAVGDVITVEQLLYGMMLSSGNDAALVTAKLVAGSTDAFVDLMNERAEEIGMEDTHFSNPHGMDDKAGKHYVTVEDMAKVAIYSARFPLLREIAKTSTYTVTARNDAKTYVLKNTNKLIYYDADVDDENYTYSLATGLKTGSTPKAGACLVATATSKDKTTKLIALIYGDESKDGADRWTVVKSLFEYGFANYTTFTAETLAEQCDISVNVAEASADDEGNGVLDAWPDLTQGDVKAFTMLKSDVQGKLKTEVTPLDGLKAPIKEGDVVGVARITVGDQTIFNGNILATRDVAEQSRIIAPSEEPAPSSQLDVSDSSRPIRFENMWYWFLIPVVLILFLIIRSTRAKKRHRRYAKSHINQRARVSSGYNRRRRRRYKYRARQRRRY